MRIVFNYVKDSDSKWFDLIKTITKIMKTAAKKFFAACEEHEKIYESYFNTIPLEIRFSARMGKATIAQASYYTLSGTLGTKTKQIIGLELSFTHVLKRYSKARLKELVIHEMAHIIDYLIRLNSNHDEPWKRINRLMGGDPTTTV